MDRKESIKTMLLGTLSLPFIKGAGEQDDKAKDREVTLTTPMRSRWYEWPDMQWVGPEYWANRLQDWRLSDGKLECNLTGENRTLHCLTHQLSRRFQDFSTSVEAEVVNKTGSGDDYIGFRLGATAENSPVPVTFSDFRRDSVYGEGIDAGITADGKLFIGNNRSDDTINLTAPVKLEVYGKAVTRAYRVTVTAYNRNDGSKLGSHTVDGMDPDELVGNIGLVASFSSVDEVESVSARFSNWVLSGGKITSNPGQVYGPILFAQYTLSRRIVKLTAQMTPVDTISGHNARLQIRESGRWKTMQETTLHPLARTAEFRMEDWTHTTDVSYRVCLDLPLKETTKTFYYEGTIAAEPASENEITVAFLNCNQHFGFPDTDVVRNVEKHRPHMTLWLGDQFYETTFGGFQVERSHDLKNSTLDYLHKWSMFGWSYREMFRHRPNVCMLDDHDVFQGNVWGQGGKAAESAKYGFGSGGHDTGGYTMLADWVKMAERTQTSHLPDPFDPTPVKQGIGVYYTGLTYAGISFAILEDRKFKTAPANVLPEEADIRNGFIRNPDFDIHEHRDIDADLLGDRQHKFLEAWAADWGEGAQMKIVLSQSPFCGAHTLPKGATSDGPTVGRRPVPKRGEYPEGDYPIMDMDTHGWPPKARDEAVRHLRKASALHLAGDQHLASIIRYGVDEYEDAGYVFVGPAITNTWPRRWWPTLEKDHRPIPGRPKYTGNFKDAFKNRITVLSMANPVQTNRVPSVIYDRSAGYGIVNCNKKERTMRLECWPRYIDPTTNPEGQFEGWPFFVDQKDNDRRKHMGYLPQINVDGLQDPVVQVYDQQSGELEYSLRIQGKSFKPHVFRDGTYKVRIGEPDLNKWQEYDNLSPGLEDQVITCLFS